MSKQKVQYFCFVAQIYFCHIKCTSVKSQRIFLFYVFRTPHSKTSSSTKSGGKHQHRQNLKNKKGSEKKRIKTKRWKKTKRKNVHNTEHIFQKHRHRQNPNKKQNIVIDINPFSKNECGVRKKVMWSSGHALHIYYTEAHKT